MKIIKLTDWAAQNDYTYRGAYGAFKAGRIPNAKRLETGAIVVEIDDSQEQKLSEIADLSVAIRELTKMIEKKVK